MQLFKSEKFLMLINMGDELFPQQGMFCIRKENQLLYIASLFDAICQKNIAAYKIWFFLVKKIDVWNLSYCE